MITSYFLYMQQKTPQKLKRGRKPQGSQKMVKEHYISTQDREYLECPIEDRKTKYTKATRGRIDLKTKRWAINALKDLKLVASAYPEEKISKIFTIEDMCKLLYAVNGKIGGEVTETGKYYQILIHEIKGAMNNPRNLERSHTLVECNINEHPVGSYR
jgi:hypothetical protein